MLLIAPEGPADGPGVEALLDSAFGPDRRRKTSYRYRDGLPPLAELCYVASAGRTLVGAIRFWPLRLDALPALLLGPLAIDPERQGQGIGRALTRATLALAEGMGWRLVFLVGDHEYYAKHGFAVAPADIVMPGESPQRLLYRCLGSASLPIGGGLLLRHTVEIAEQRRTQSGQALVAGHAGLHLAQALRQGGSDARFGDDLVQASDQGAYREHHGAGSGQPAQRLPLDPHPQPLPRILGGEVG